MEENEIGRRVLGLAIKVHKALGPGLLESAYESCLAYELTEAGLNFERQLLLPLHYAGIDIEQGLRAFSASSAVRLGESGWLTARGV